MPNNRAKGRRKELKARDILLARGYSVQLAPTPTRWAMQTDMFGGLWDIVAIGPTDMVCVQVKSANKISKAWREKAKAWVCPENCSKELWVMEDRKGVRVIKL